jgi:hypothetical protein
MILFPSLVIIVHLVIHWDESWLLGGLECGIYAIAGLLSGQIKLPHFSPAGSCGPLRIRVSLMACTVTLVAVKVTVQPASQNLPMLTRLLVNVGIIWPVSVSLGSTVDPMPPLLTISTIVTMLCR